MDTGFHPDHFTLLQRWNAVPRDKTDPDQNAAYDRLVEAYEATAAWAYGVRDSLFPQGWVRKLSKPTDQAQKFKPYTWVRIYPRRDAPTALAYTVGIDSDGAFCVKIDTVNQHGPVRRRYEALHGGDHQTSPFAAVLSAEQGLRLAREDLVAWSVEAIGRFEPSYDTLARELGLLDTPIRLVIAPDASRAGFQRWVDTMMEGASHRGAVLALAEHRVFLRSTASGPRVAMKLGLDPRGAEWAVEINEPAVAGDFNVLSAIGGDETGGRFLLRQGWLRGRRDTPDVREDEFIARTGLAPTAVEATGRAAKRRWFIVANLDDPPEAIRRETARFVDLCWTARTPLSSDEEDGADEDDGAALAAAETGGFFTVGPRAATDPRVVRLLQGEVWSALAETLSARGISYRKWIRKGGYAIDMEIDRVGDKPIILEIKSGTSASDLHTGIGQLYLYRQLFRRLGKHLPVLLLDGPVPAPVRRAVERLDVQLHHYTREGEGDAQRIVFSPAFLALCGVPEGVILGP